MLNSSRIKELIQLLTYPPYFGTDDWDQYDFRDIQTALEELYDIRRTEGE